MAAHQGHAAIVNQLCRVARAEVDGLDNAGCTPLHHATALGHDAVVMELWSKSANVDLADANGWTGDSPCRGEACLLQGPATWFLAVNCCGKTIPQCRVLKASYCACLVEDLR